MLAMLNLTAKEICELIIFASKFVFLLILSVLHYKSQGATKDKGCTVDLLTNIRNKILFTAGLRVTKDIGTCPTWNFNENTLVCENLYRKVSNLELKKVSKNI